MRAAQAAVMQSSRVCAACHEDHADPRDTNDDFRETYVGPPSQTTYSEWAASDFATKGVQCQDCHMPPAERRVIVPFLVLVPLLFVAGVVFGYYVVLPAALKFLLNFNSDQFQVQVRASDYYGFATLTLMAMGIVFQVPIGILALTRLGITTPRQLSKNRRYAYLILAIIAMLLPGTDPITMLVELAPLLVLYEFSIVLARALDRPAAGAGPAAEGAS